MNATPHLQQATLGGGCFWCLQPLFRALRGVHDAVAGYAGGRTPSPTYEQVCSGFTGHAEVVQVTFDPDVLPYRTLLEVFFDSHDPTTRNRQGADVGAQYRSIILYHDLQQEQTARQLIESLNRQNVFGKPLVTELQPLTGFYAAEDYHQDYYHKNPHAGYCQMVIRPKVAKFKQHFGERMKPESGL